MTDSKTIEELRERARRQPAGRVLENLAAFLFECDHCCCDSVFTTVEGEQLCREHLDPRGESHD